MCCQRREIVISLLTRTQPSRARILQSAQCSQPREQEKTNCREAVFFPQEEKSLIVVHPLSAESTTFFHIASLTFAARPSSRWNTCTWRSSSFARFRSLSSCAVAAPGPGPPPPESPPPAPPAALMESRLASDETPRAGETRSSTVADDDPPRAAAPKGAAAPDPAAPIRISTVLPFGPPRSRSSGPITVLPIPCGITALCGRSALDEPSSGGRTIVVRKVIGPGEVDEGGGARTRVGKREGSERRWIEAFESPTRSVGEWDDRCKEVMVSLR